MRILLCQKCTGDDMHSWCFCLNAFLICYHGRWAHLPTLLYPFIVGVHDSALTIYAGVCLSGIDCHLVSWQKALDSVVHVCRTPWS